MKHSLFRTSATLLIPICAAACATIGPPPPPTEPPALREASEIIQKALNALDTALAEIAEATAQSGMTEPVARGLSALVAATPGCAGYVVLDAAGRVSHAQPEETAGLAQALFENVDTPFATEPLLTKARHVNAAPMTALVRPIGDGSQGHLVLLLSTAPFLRVMIEPLIVGLPVDCWVIQTDGLTLYDPDEEEIGLNILTDPLYRGYPGLRTFTEAVVSREEGESRYRFLATGLDTDVSKQGHWVSVGLHGTAWRLGMVQVVQGNSHDARRRFSELELLVYRDSLRLLARNPALQAALDTGNRSVATQHLAQYFEQYPGLYAVQWGSRDGVTQFGFPPANSLSNYNHRSGRAAADRDFAAALRRGREGMKYITLRESNETALLYMTPVSYQGRRLGSLYIIRLIPPDDIASMGEAWPER